MSYFPDPNSTIENMKERMEAIFGHTQSQSTFSWRFLLSPLHYHLGAVITRMKVLEASSRALVEAEALFEDVRQE